MIYKFSGGSDDTFGEYHEIGDDYDNCANGKPIRWKIWSDSQRAGLIVIGQYCPYGSHGWMIGVAPIGLDCDDAACFRAMGWGLSFQQNETTPYSPLLVIANPPSDCEVVCLEREGAEA